MFNQTNEDDVKKSFEYTKERVQGFYNSSIYSDAWDRYGKRYNAYKCKHNSDAPKWKSKLHFATFFLGCKAIDAQLKKSHRNDPWIYVSLENGKTADKKAVEMARLAHYDINHDIYISRLTQEINKMYWYVEMFGCAIGREYVVSDSVEQSTRQLKNDSYGFEGINAQAESKMSRREHTKTEVIHPLNFAHDVNKSDFSTSRWGSVRFELPIAELYKMRNSPLAYKPGIEAIIKEIEGQEIPTWTAAKDTFYSEYNNAALQKNNSIIVDEYSGDFNYKGNYDDNTLYYQLFSKKHNQVIAIGTSPFKRHHYWKMQTYPDPQGPYPVGPNDMFLPLNYWKNSTANQYNDYMNAVLKFQYEVYPGNIVGGLNSLINGVQGSFVIADSGEKLGQTIKPINKDKSSIPPVGDILNLIEKEIQDSGPSSNLRGKSSNQLNDTATGIGLMAQREDTAMDALRDEIDGSIEDAVQMKLENRMKYMTQEVVASLDSKSPAVRYYPWELDGQDYSFKVRRETSDIQSGKYMSYLKLVMGLANTGQVPPEHLIKLTRKVGEALGIDESDQIPEPIPPQIGMGGAEAPTALAAGATQQNMPPSPIQSGGLNVAAALA